MFKGRFFLLKQYHSQRFILKNSNAYMQTNMLLYGGVLCSNFRIKKLWNYELKNKDVTRKQYYNHTTKHYLVIKTIF